MRDDAQINGPPTGMFGALRLGGRLLALVFNSASEPRNYRLSIKNAAGDFADYPAGKKIKQNIIVGPQGIEITVPARDVYVLVGKVNPDF
ncbi:MAG: hypothetical protein ABIH24_00635 [Verrucomicrobiota bacterium]